MARRARGSRRKTQWGRIGDANAGASMQALTGISAGSAAIIAQGVIVAGAAGIVDEEFTVTRTIGAVAARSTAAAGTNAILSLGCYVARVEAINAGVGSLPDPASDADAEWLYWTAYNLKVTTVDDPAGLATVRMHFDVRGQRIVRTGESLVWIGRFEDGAGEVAVQGRYLVKLT